MRKHSITIHGHETSITLEDEFWQALKQQASQQNLSLNKLIAKIDDKRGTRNLSSAIRVYILKNLQQKIAD